MFIVIPSQFNETKLALRSRDVHIEQCDRLEEEDYSAEFSKEYGINQRSPLLELKYFDMCNGALITDIMHDLLEGVLPYEVKNLLRHLVANDHINGSQLNGIMESFEFGFMEISNRPTPISKATLKTKDNSLKQNGKATLVI